MRTSLYLVGFAAASMLGAGAIGFGCSSSSSSGTTPPVDSGTLDTSTTEDGGEDAGPGDDGMATPDVAMVCTPAPVKIDTFDAGTTWACTQAACADGGLSACAADCTCNAAIFAALLCVSDAGAAKTVDCFTSAITPVISDSVVLPFATCLQSPAVTKCTSGGGTDGGDGGGGGSDAGDGGTGTDTGAPKDAGDGG